MDDPDLWQWVWLGAALVFGLGEMASPGSFFLAPFAVAAAFAAAAALLGAVVGVSWLVFIVVSLVSFAALRPLARRLDAAGGNPTGVGAQRLVGEQAIVLQDIPAGLDEVGLIRVGREEWRAQTPDGTSVPRDTRVTVTEVRGTRVVVHPTERIIPSTPPERPI
ncbi:NfeD family protein [Actinospongicola halichondriae]|uniref:NfeD family protein n=1 Tax=Actinospongicola halichondriae TaxID=3236844 RepID=UPI003D4292F7